MNKIIVVGQLSIFLFFGCGDKQSSNDNKQLGSPLVVDQTQDSIRRAEVYLQRVAVIAQKNRLQIPCRQLSSFLRRSVGVEGREGKSLRQFYPTLGPETSIAKVDAGPSSMFTQDVLWIIACERKHIHQVKVTFLHGSLNPSLLGEAWRATIDGFDLANILDLSSDQIAAFAQSIPGKRMARIEAVFGDSNSDENTEETVVGKKKVQK